jgi:ZIP family zinc transporter
LTSAFVASLAAFLVTLLSGLGALVLRRHKSVVFASCAGALIGGAAFFLLPDAFHFFEESASTLSSLVVWGVAALGFAVFYALERGRHAPESARIAGIGGALGLAVHSFLDGVIIGEGFRAGNETGFVLAVAVMLHRLADGASAVGVMLGTEHGIRQTAFMLLVTALAPIAGAVVSSFFSLPAFFLSLLLSFFSGMLLFLGAKHLIPEARRAAASNVTVPASFAVGFMVVYAAYLLSH